MRELSEIGLNVIPDPEFEQDLESFLPKDWGKNASPKEVQNLLQTALQSTISQRRIEVVVQPLSEGSGGMVAFYRLRKISADV